MESLKANPSVALLAQYGGRVRTYEELPGILHALLEAQSDESDEEVES